MKKVIPTARFFHNGIHSRGTLLSIDFNRSGLVVVGECLRNDLLGTWQPPQGGCTETEVRSPEGLMKAALRENREELGFKKHDLLFLGAAAKLLGYTMREPDEKYQATQLTVAAFLVRDGATWDLNSQHNGTKAEFGNARYVELEAIPDFVAPHKRDAMAEAAVILKPFSDALKFYEDVRVQAGVEASFEELGKKIQSYQDVWNASVVEDLQPTIPMFHGKLSRYEPIT